MRRNEESDTIARIGEMRKESCSLEYEEWCSCGEERETCRVEYEESCSCGEERERAEVWNMRNCAPVVRRGVLQYGV